MAKFDFRILLETVEGNKSSYMSQSFVDTSVDLVLSASQVYNRITGSVSCSYQNSAIFSGSDPLSSIDINQNKTFKDNALLSASLSGSANTGSIEFDAVTSEYDRLLRYKFFGEKVCNTLGLPHDQWVYVDQVRFPVDDESNIFQGNIDVGTAFVSDTLTFANNANINSDVPFYIDTGSDRYIKFIDTRGSGNASLIFGYDKDTDSYEINASEDTTFNIRNLNNLTVDTITASVVLQATSSTQTTVETEFTNIVTQNITASGNISASGEITSSKLLVTGTSKFNGDVVIDGRITAEEFITQEITVNNGSNIFGNSADDIQRFTGSIQITGSGPHFFQTGNVGIGVITPTKKLQVAGDISASGDLFVSKSIFIDDGSGTYGDATFTVIDDRLQIKDKSNVDVHIDSNHATGSGEFRVKAHTGNHTRMLVSSSGQVGIGTTTPTSTLQVEGDISSSTNLHASGGFFKSNVSSSILSTGSFGRIEGTTLHATSVSDTLAAAVVSEIDDNEIAIAKLAEDSITITAGDGLTGAGTYTLGQTKTINVVGGGGISMSADNVAVNPSQTTITSILAEDLKIGEDNQTKIDFGTPDEIHFYANNNKEVVLAENSLSPGTSNGTALGTTSLQWSDLFLADGGVINFKNGDVTLTHTSNTLTMGGGNFVVNGNLTANSMSGDGSGITGVTAEWDGSINGDAEITGSLVLSGTGNITASGGISASGNIIGSEGIFDSGKIRLNIDTSGDGFDSKNTSTTSSIIFGSDGTDKVQIMGYETGTDSTLLLQVTDDSSDSIRIETKGSGGDKVNARGDVKIQGGSITNTISGDSADSFNVQFENSSSDGRRFTSSLFVSSSGNVGIGTISPVSSLHIAGKSDSYPNKGGAIMLEDTGAPADLKKFNIFTHDGSFRIAPGNDADSAANSFLIATTNVAGKPDSIQLATHEASTYAERMRITGSKVGIGTTTPTKPLQVEGSISSSDDFEIFNGTNRMKYDASAHDLNFNGGAFKLFSNAHDITIETDNFNNAIVIDDSEQRIGIGTTSPTSKLQVSGDVTATHITASGNISASGTVFASAFSSPDGDGDIDFSDSLDVAGNITASGNIKAGGTITAEQLTSTDDLSVGGAGNGRINVGTIGVLNGESVSQFGIASPGIINIQADNDNNSAGSADRIDFEVGVKEIMRISGSGNVGIGTTSPTTPLYVNAGSNNQKIVTFTGNNTNRGLEISTYQESNHDAGVILDAVDASHGTIKFQTATTDAMTIDKNQKVGIGETLPDEKLHLKHGNFRIETADESQQSIRFTEDDVERARIEFDSLDANKDLSIQTTNAAGALLDRLVVKHSQDDTQIGIGVSTPTKALQVQGDISASGTVFADAFQSVTGGSTIDFNDNIKLVGDISSSATGSFFNVEIPDNGQIRFGADNDLKIYHNSSHSIIEDSGTGNLILLSNVFQVKNAANNQTMIQANQGGAVKLLHNNSEKLETTTNGIDVTGGINTTAKITIGEAGGTGEKLDVIGDTKAHGNISSPTFFPGFGVGSTGFQITSGSDGNTTLTIDDLNVRKTLNVFEFLIHQIRATNGSLFISNTGKVLSASLSSVANHYSMSFETGSGLGHSFKEGDLIRARRFVPSINGSGSVSFVSDLTVVSTDATSSLIAALTASADEQHPFSASAPQPGYEYVRIGNTTELDRQGSIYLTADDDNAPFIDVVDGLTAHSQFNTSGKIKVRMGKLDGVTTANPAFGTLDTFGIYASGSVYIEGSINASNGKIAEFSIASSSISSSNNKLKLFSDGVISGSDVAFEGGTIGGFTIGSTIISSSTGTLILKNDGTMTGSAVSMSGTIVTNDISATSGSIGGFVLDSTSLTAFSGSTVSSSFVISSSNQPGELLLSSSNFKVSNLGDVTASNVDLSGKITSTEGSIGGFSIDNTTISSSTGTLILDSNTNSGEIKLGGATGITSGDGIYMAGDKKFRVGQASNNFIRFNNTANILEIKTPSLDLDSSGNLTISGTLSSSIGNIGGFTLDSSEIKSNNASGDTGLRLKAGGQITASNAKITGDIVANTITANTAGTIGGFGISATTISSSTGTLILRNNGQITASTAKITGDINATNITSLSGSIGGFTISDTFISGGNLTLDSNGIINVGNLNGVGDIGDDSTGFRVENNGEVLIKQGGANSNYIRFDNNVIDINTGKATISGSEVNISSPSVFLGQGTTNFISASGGKLEISSSNFHLLEGNITASNVTLTGEINATTGNFDGTLNASTGSIGGFTIDAHSLTTSGVEINDITQDLFINTNNFDVSHAGNITASNVVLTGSIIATDGTFSGSISASDGTIGGFTITSTIASANQNIILDPIGNEISVGTGTEENVIKIDSDDGLFAGANTEGTRTDTTPFQVSPTGRMTASTAQIIGNSFVSCSITSTGSFGRLGGSAQHTTLGSGSVELNTFTSDTTMYEAINTIDNILSKLAPAKPADLSTLSLQFSSVNVFSVYGQNGGITGSVITDTTPTIKPGGSSNLPFFDGDNGVLTLQRSVDSGSSFTDITTHSLSTASDVSGSSSDALQITADEDPFSGTVGSEGFWKQLKVTINETGRGPGVKTYVSRLIHSITGQAADLVYMVETDGQLSTITNTAITHSVDENGQHFQSGIPYLGQNDDISSSYAVSIHGSANFLNEDRKIGSTRFADAADATEQFKRVDNGATWNSGEAFTTTASLSINNDRFHSGFQKVVYEEYKSTSTLGEADDDQAINQRFNIDSKVEDETNPSNGLQTTFRSGSGTGQFPEFAFDSDGNAAATTFGGVFNTTASLTTDDHDELQFSNQYFHWPDDTNYSNFIPPGPDYSGITGGGYEGIRWATFNLGTMGTIQDPVTNVTIRLEGCNGFDSSVIQESDDFEMYLKVMSGSSHTELTKWIDCNREYVGGNPGSSNNDDAGLTSGTTFSGTDATLDRTITFGEIARTGTVFVRVGWKVSGGTSPTSPSTRKFKYIYIT